MLNIVWGLTHKWSQIIFLHERDFPSFVDIISGEHFNNKFLFEAINALATLTSIKCLETKKHFLDIDNLNLLKKARRLIHD